MTPPKLKDWKSDLQRRIQHKGQSEEDLLAVIHMCMGLLNEIQPAFMFVQEQKGEISDWLMQYQQLFMRRFKKEPTSLPADELPDHLVLDTPEKRKKAVREIAIALSTAGGEISDKNILQAIGKEGMRFVAQNPTAAVSTILYGFSSAFEKVEGKMGTFRRRTEGVKDSEI